MDDDVATRGTTTAALAELYERRYHRFLRVAEALVGDPDAAHDVVQDAFAEALRNRHAFRGEGELEAWVWRIVVNAAHRTRRSRGPDVAPLEEQSLIDAAARNGRPHASQVRRVVARLPERQRLVLFLRYYAGLNYEQISAALEISTGTVGATLHQAHAVLQPLLEETPR